MSGSSAETTGLLEKRLSISSWDTVSKDGGQVDAITASTITSRAFLLAVNNAYAAYSGQNTDANSGASQQVEASESGTEDADSASNNEITNKK